MGFGARSITHTDKLLRLSADLPVVIEAVEGQEKIDALLPRLDVMLSGGMITLEKVRVIRYSKCKMGLAFPRNGQESNHAEPNQDPACCRPLGGTGGRA
jgi:hypothetical protein